MQNQRDPKYSAYNWRNKKQVDREVKGTASIIRHRMEPLRDRVTGSLDDLAELIQGVNRRVRHVTAVVDAALERVA